MSAIGKERKKLKMMNRDIFDEMNEYLSIKNLNDLVRRDLLLDILGMFQECELSELDPKEVFGNYEIFCNEIAKNAIHKTKLEIILSISIKIWGIFLLVVIWGMLMLLGDNQIFTQNMELIVPWKLLELP